MSGMPPSSPPPQDNPYSSPVVIIVIVIGVLATIALLVGGVWALYRAGKEDERREQATKSTSTSSWTFRTLVTNASVEGEEGEETLVKETEPEKEEESIFNEFLKSTLNLHPLAALWLLAAVVLPFGILAFAIWGIQGQNRLQQEKEGVIIMCIILLTAASLFCCFLAYGYDDQLKTAKAKRAVAPAPV